MVKGVKMEEVFLGSDTDCAYMRAYLENIRMLDPIEITTLPDAIHLGDDRIIGVIDVEYFRCIVHDCIQKMKHKNAINIKPIDWSRYYTTLPMGNEAIGGFHNPKSLGYQYWYNASFVLSLNAKMTSVEIRTLEMARNFLHDSLHHSTFRSYRRAMRVPAKTPKDAKHRVPEVYREQYGISFRNRDGISYSSPN